MRQKKIILSAHITWCWTRPCISEKENRRSGTRFFYLGLTFFLCLTLVKKKSLILFFSIRRPSTTVTSFFCQLHKWFIYYHGIWAWFLRCIFGWILWGCFCLKLGKENLSVANYDYLLQTFSLTLKKIHDRKDLKSPFHKKRK